MKAVPGDAPLAGLEDLRKVDLDDQPIDDTGMAHFRGLVELKMLSIRPEQMTRTRPNITDAGLAPLRKLTNLRRLMLSGTTIQGAGLDQLAGMTELSQLELDFTLIDDAGLSHLPAFPKLRSLNLTQTKVTDASIPVIKKQTGLTYLGLLGTHISDAGIEELRRWREGMFIHKPEGTTTPDQGEPSLIPPVPAAPF